MHTRRQFLAAGAATLAAPALNALGANEKLNIGLIGSGNRGRTIIRECIKNGHHVVAASDIAKFRQDFITDTIVKDGQPKPTFLSKFGGDGFEPALCFGNHSLSLDYSTHLRGTTTIDHARTPKAQPATSARSHGPCTSN